MRRFISSIIVLIFCILASCKQFTISGCYSMADGLLIAFFYFLIFVFLMILLIRGVYQKVKYKNSINLYPFITFVFCICVISIISFFYSERFKSDKLLKASNNNQDLVLRIDDRYELKHKQTEQSCLEIGTYEIANDTIYLTEEPRFDRTIYVNEKYLIDKINKRLIPIYKDSLRVDIFLRIENNYAP